MCADDVTGQIRKKHMSLIKGQGIPGLDCFKHVRISPLTMHIYFINTIVKSLCLSITLTLAHLLLQEGTRAKTARPKERRGETENTTVCRLMKVSEIGLKRGKCHQCLKKKRKRLRFTSFGCSECRVRLCKMTFFAEYHQQF